MCKATCSEQAKIRGLTLLVRVLQGPGGRRAILPRLRAQVVIETRASRHGLGVEVGRERAILQQEKLCYSAQNP